MSVYIIKMGVITKWCCLRLFFVESFVIMRVNESGWYFNDGEVLSLKYNGEMVSILMKMPDALKYKGKTASILTKKEF
ncbi:MAG: hypothetical protein LRY73_10310 [Bacillus sp. (in: Bacteria)]|nr:hypothetical protein [Bacillus sp. (in: firmicutes)]